MILSVDAPELDPRARALMRRLDGVENRLTHVAASALPGLTAPDRTTGEQWESGQVWAHVAEFVPYWLGQVREIVAAESRDPVAFGRTKTDAGRLAAIERDRHERPAALLERTSAGIREVREWLQDAEPAAWSLRGVHPTLGEMDLSAIVEEFIVRHLEEHAAQLESLAATPRSGA